MPPGEQVTEMNYFLSNVSQYVNKQVKHDNREQCLPYVEENTQEEYFLKMKFSKTFMKFECIHCKLHEQVIINCFGQT